MKFPLHLDTEAKGVSANNNQIVNVRKDPERTGGGAPEDAGVGNRDGETNFDNESAQLIIAGK